MTTGSLRGQPWWARALYAVIATTPERSAVDAVRFLLADDVRHACGAAFTSPRRYEPVPIAYDPALASRLWALTEELVRARPA